MRASRDWLIDLLWQNALERRSIQSLNQAIYTLRRILGKSALELTQSKVVLRAPIWTDAAALTAALRASAVQEVCALYRDPFLKDVPLLSDTFDDWRTTVDHGFRDKVQQALSRAWRCASFDEQVKLLDDATRLLPDDVAVQRFQISTLIAKGDRESARAEFDRLKGNESGMSPTLSWDDVVRASTAIGNQRHTAPAYFVGRGFELSTLSILWRECHTEGGRLVLVSGDAGIGKTTLCQAFIGGLPSTTNVICVAAYESARHVGYNVLADVVAAVNPQAVLKLPRTLAASLADFVPSIQVSARVRSELPEPAAERRLHEAATRLILSLCSDAPLVLVLDDLQWCDNASIAWLLFLLRTVRTEQVMIILAGRSVNGQFPLVRLSDRPTFLPTTKLNVSEFTPAEVDVLLRESRPDLYEPNVSKKLFARTAGHPFFLAQLLQFPDLRLVSNDDSVLSTYVQNALDRLPVVTQQLVEMLAAAGTPLSANAVALLTESTLAQVLTQCNDAAQLCSISDDGLVYFRHDVAREVVYKMISEPVRRLYHLRLAEYFRDIDAPASVQAHHFAESGSGKTFGICMEAATGSELRLAYGEAEHFYRLCVKHAPDLEVREAATARLADMLYRAGRHTIAEPLINERVSTTAGDDRKQLTWMWKLAVSRLSIGAHEELDDLTRIILARGRSVQDTDANYYALYVRTVLFANSAVPEAALEELGCLSALLDLAESNPITPSGVRAVALAAQMTSVISGAGAGLALARRAKIWAEQLGSPDLTISAYRILGLLAYNAGMFDVASNAYEAALGLIEAHGAAFYESRVLICYGSLLVETGDYDKAQALLERAERSSDRKVADSWATATANQAQLALQTGDYPKCAENADNALSAPGLSAWTRLEVLGYRGLARLEMGQLEGAYADAELVRNEMRDLRGFRYDMSYAFLLITRIALIRRRAHELVDLLRSAMNFYQERDFVCHLRIGLGLSECLAGSDPAEAFRIAQAIKVEADSRGLNGVSELAGRTLRHVKRHPRL